MRYDIDAQLAYLKKQINGLKVEVDKCFLPGIYVHTFQIGSMSKIMKQEDMTTKQKDLFNQLDEDTLKQFKRLSEGRCSCNVSKDI